MRSRSFVSVSAAALLAAATIHLTSYETVFARASARMDCVMPVVDILGTEADVVIMGTPGNDTIQGLGGNDVIFGLCGDDIICGGLGNDTIWGGDGADLGDGGPGTDTATDCEILLNVP